jgi:hypothetical protein
MRVMIGLSLGMVGLSGLAACSESDEAFRARYRTEAIASCVQGARTSNPGNLDPNRFCPCMVDGYMRGTPSERLRAERNDNTPPPAAQTAMAQCARDLMGGPAGATPPAEANRQAEATEAEEPATDAGENSQ